MTVISAAPLISTVMINSMCQLDCAMESPNVWANLILGVSLRVFGDEINIYISRLNKADCVMCVSLKQSVEGLLRTKSLTAT